MAEPVTTPAHQLQSEEQKTLLDAIDRLRSDGINETIGIPEIVVCGDQSSGKSSVLEAIAGVSFPMEMNTITRFPTELVLRKSLEILPHDICIRPESSHWSKDQRRQVEAWRPEGSIGSATDISGIVNQAYKFLKSLDETRNCWHDRLRIEICGPDQPHLTLIDLPGLVQNESHNVDKQGILQMTRHYIASEQAIILAVLDAPTDLNRHQIIQLLDENLSKRRAMGVLTKPDGFGVGDEREADRIGMITQGNVNLGLGWHVVCNLKHDVDDRSSAHRDEKEQEFFSDHRAWAKVPDDQKGAPQLRVKLSNQLLKRIHQDLPRLIRKVDNELKDRNRTLAQLGEARETEEEKRDYLIKIAEKMMALIKCALGGDYWNEDVEGFFLGKSHRQLREVINGHIDTFAREMKEQGHLYRMIDDERREGNTNKRYPPLRPFERVSFLSDSSATSVERRSIPRQVYIQALSEHIDRNRGLNPRGTVPPAMYPSIFRLQSRPWRSIVDHCAEDCQRAVQNFLEDASCYVASKHGGSLLFHHLVMPTFKERSQHLKEKLDELLWPFLHGHLFINSFNTLRMKADEAENTSDGRLEPDTQGDSMTAPKYAAKKAIELTDLYYDIARNTLVQNIATLGIERCLLDGLSKIVSPSTLSNFDSETLAHVAAERSSDRNTREKCNRQVTTLSEVLDTFSSLSGGGLDEVTIRESQMMSQQGFPYIQDPESGNSRFFSWQPPSNGPQSLAGFGGFGQNTLFKIWSRTEVPSKTPDEWSSSIFSGAGFGLARPTPPPSKGFGSASFGTNPTPALNTSSTKAPNTSSNVPSGSSRFNGSSNRGATSSEPAASQRTSALSGTPSQSSGSAQKKDAAVAPSSKWFMVEQKPGEFPVKGARVWGSQDQEWFFSISAHPTFQAFSHEEIRMTDEVVG